MLNGNCSVVNLRHFSQTRLKVVLCVVALSYSESIGKSEPGFKHSILMQPFRIMSYYDLLRLPNDFTRRIRETGVTTIEELKRLFQLYSKIDTGKLIDVLSELHIVLRDYKTGGMLTHPC